jgi:hypothetical protein
MNDDQYFEHLLGDLDYLSEMFIMNRIKKHGVASDVN